VQNVNKPYAGLLRLHKPLGGIPHTNFAWLNSQAGGQMMTKDPVENGNILVYFPGRQAGLLQPGQPVEIIRNSYIIGLSQDHDTPYSIFNYCPLYFLYLFHNGSGPAFDITVFFNSQTGAW